MLIVLGETRKEVNAWLNATWTNDLYDNAIRKRLTGTCEWFLNLRAFLDWISPDFPLGNMKVLWVKGPLGYGKTILCARVIEHISTVLDFPFAYYFFSS
jgi:hypothetical protein